MPSLFELSHNLQALESLLEREDEAEAQEAIVAELAATRDGLESKVEAYAGFIGELEAIAAARSVEAKRVAQLAKTTANKAERLRQAVKEALQRIGTRKVSTVRYDVRLQRSGGKATLDIDESRLPAEWAVTKTIVEPDKERIRAALEGGEVLDFAELKERSEILVIK